MSSFAMIFPGQGSQSVGMMNGFAATAGSVQATFEQASAALGRDLWRLVCDGPAEDLNQTCWTQPVMLTADIAVWRLWREAGGAMPAAMAGHSLGEYAALVAAGAMELADAVRVVHLRGNLMQQAVAEGEGAMAAILGLEDSEVERLCAEHSGDRIAVAANYNAPGQVVISGHLDAIERVIEACRAAGAKRALKLPVSVPAHSPLMQPAAPELRAALEQIKIRAVQCPVLHNCSLAPAADAAAIRQALVEQLTRPVPWTQTIAALVERGIQRFVECGPGRVLAGLGRRIERAGEWPSLDSDEAIEKALA
ncbi:MAG: ACP S-malonyltransferase [Wenzhouxiangellaceae bacterium]